VKHLALVASLALAQSCFAQVDNEPLVGTVLDPAGKPIAGARVEMWRSEGQGFVGLDLEYARTFTKRATVPTDKNGRFAMQVPVGHPYELRIDQAPHARWIGRQSVVGGEMQVRLQPGATYVARLTSHDGSPASGRVRAWFVDSHEEAWNGRTDAAGVFRIERVPPGQLRVEVQPDAAPSPAWSDITLTAGATFEHEVPLARGVLLQGRIVDAATGKPIDNASVGEGWTMRRRVGTDREGRYAMRGYGSPGASDVHCQAPGYVEQIVRNPGTAKDPLTLDFRLERGLAATGRVVDPDAKPVAGLYVRVFATRHDGKEQVHDCVSTRTAADGSFLVTGLRSELDHVLVLRGEPWATAVYALPAADATGTKLAGELRLAKPNTVRGVLVGPDGKPRPAAKVMIWGYNSDRHRLDPRGALAKAAMSTTRHAPNSWGLLDMYVGGHEVTTNAEGQFAFAALPVGTFRLIAYAENNHRVFEGDNFEVPVAASRPFELVTDK